MYPGWNQGSITSWKPTQDRLIHGGSSPLHSFAPPYQPVRVRGMSGLLSALTKLIWIGQTPICYSSFWILFSIMFPSVARSSDSMQWPFFLEKDRYQLSPSSRNPSNHKAYPEFSEVVAPDVVILTETNVPHQENISYFGKGDEAHAVYQFSLPPLLFSRVVAGNFQLI